LGYQPLLNVPENRESKRGEYGVPTKTKFLWGKKPQIYYREFKRDEVPLKKNLPLPLAKGKGIQGIGF